MSAADYLVVVYQFGKVASTTLVNSLNTCKRIEAHQSHFLGEDALQRMVPNIVDTKVGAYFRQHMIGQLVNNLELTHQVNCCLKGHSAQELVVISLSREPVDWFRSCIQQDIEGYRSDILGYGGAQANDSDVESGLIAVLSDLNEFLDEQGGAQAVVEAIKDNKTSALLANDQLLRHDIARRMLLLAMRPLVWFDDHFARCFQFGLTEIPAKGDHWLLKKENGSFLIMRYEDIESVFPTAMRDVGLPFDGPLCHANSSQDKPNAAEIRAAFKSAPANELRDKLLDSDYARHFRYKAEQSVLTAA